VRNVFAYNLCHDSTIQASWACSITATTGPTAASTLRRNVSPKFQADGTRQPSPTRSSALVPWDSRRPTLLDLRQLNRSAGAYSVVGTCWGARPSWPYDNDDKGYGYDQHLIYSLGMPHWVRRVQRHAQAEQGPPLADWAKIQAGEKGPRPAVSRARSRRLETTLLKGNFNYKHRAVPASESPGGASMSKALPHGETAWFGSWLAGLRPDAASRRTRIPARPRFESMTGIGDRPMNLALSLLLLAGSRPGQGGSPRGIRQVVACAAQPRGARRWTAAAEGPRQGRRVGQRSITAVSVARAARSRWVPSASCSRRDPARQGDARRERQNLRHRSRRREETDRARPRGIRIKRGDVAVEVEKTGPCKLRRRVPVALRPDARLSFSDDMVIDAAKSRRRRGAPERELLLHFREGRRDRDAGVREPATDVRCTVAGIGEPAVSPGRRSISAREEGLDRAPRSAADLARGQGPARDSKKESKLELDDGLAAQWRVDFTRSDDLTDSWDLCFRGRGGQLREVVVDGRGRGTIGPARKRWSTVLNSFKFPAVRPESRSA